MKPLFGKMFDLDGNGYATPEEELFGITVMEKIREGQEVSQSNSQDAFAFPPMPTYIPNGTLGETYPCGIKTFQAYTGNRCIRTGIGREQRNGYVPCQNAVYYYEDVSKLDFERYVRYIQSLGINYLYKDEDDFSTTYNFFVAVEHGSTVGLMLTYCEGDVQVLHTTT